MDRPNFSEIKNYDEFLKYYWYGSELIKICKNLGINYIGTKNDLNSYIKDYFNGIIDKQQNKVKVAKNNSKDNLNSRLLDCGFSLNSHYREFFANETGISPFHFTADMATAWRKVKKDKNTTFTIKDLLDVYYGNSDYAKYDNSACQWNQFVSDFCKDPNNKYVKNKFKEAAKLWKIAKESDGSKKYK